MNEALSNLVKNLRALIDSGVYENESAMARACHIPQRTLNRVLQQQVGPTLETVAQIAKGVGISIPMLLSADMRVGDDDFSMVRRLDVKASAGDGNLVFMEADKGRLAFRRDFLRQIGVREGDAVLIYADGQSMEPKIPDGAVLLVDTGHTELSNNDIHVIRVDGEILVKRLRKEIGGGVWIVSDNPDKGRYPDILVTPDKEDHLTIIGRVFWMGARL